MDNKKLLKAVKNLLKAIDDNRWELWENSLEYKPDCVLFYDNDYEINEKENGEWELEYKTGIWNELKVVKNLINNEGSE